VSHFSARGGLRESYRRHPGLGAYLTERRTHGTRLSYTYFSGQRSNIPRPIVLDVRDSAVAALRAVEKSSRIPELDGLRGVAILLVIFYHYTNGHSLTPANGLAFYVERAAGAGWSGVDLFFVLSGFLIGGILIEARGSRSFFQTFYIRRFFRIIPIYYGWILLYLALVAVAGPAIQARSFSGKTLPNGFEVYAHFFFLQNLVPFHLDVIPGMWKLWFSHLWSLAVEEQFYLIAPLMIAWLPPRRLPAALAAIVCAAPVLRTALFFHVRGVDTTHIVVSRADALALGILAAIAWRSPKSRLWLNKNVRLLYIAAGLLFSGYGLLCWYAPDSSSLALNSFGLSWIAIFYALLLLLALAGSDDWFARVMRVAWLRGIGRVSYCMYIVHLIVALFLYSVFLHERPEIVTLSGGCAAILAAVLTYVVARISWLLVEHPLIRVGHGFQYAPAEARQVAELATD
jgi:peptidoglycan/LPS O-acetylase OafA/YrhL